MPPLLLFLASALLFPLLLIASGYGAGAFVIKKEGPARLSAACLLGLGVLLLNLSLFNLFVALDLVWSLASLWPVLLSALLPPARNAIVSDFKAVMLRSRGWVATLSCLLLLGLLLGPILLNPELVLFDGTSNHDSYFWVTAAAHLQSHNYLTPPLADPLHPALISVPAIIGTNPLWGRMGAEGLLAFCSSLAGQAPESMLLLVSALLLVPWLASCHLLYRAFFSSKIPLWAVPAFILLQPVFLFAHLNSNLPNLLGSLFGATALAALQGALTKVGERKAWRVLLALSIHGVLCSYPEIAPFVALPCALLWLRYLLIGKAKDLKEAMKALGICFAGLLLNPISLLRAWHGFEASFATARANQNWANILAPVEPPEFLPGLFSLNPSAADSLGWILGSLISATLLAGFALAYLRAKDRLGALLITAGGVVLAAYTLYSNFHYGWQKSIQFAGPVVAVWCTSALVALGRAAPENDTAVKKEGWYALLGRSIATLTLLLFFSFCILHSLGKSWWWSNRKVITKEWQVLALDKGLKQGHPHTLLIDSGSFATPFFHGMWAAYFAQDTKVIYATRDPEAGGYNRFHCVQAGSEQAPQADAILVSRQWADSWDANSPRLYNGKELVLLSHSNTLKECSGFYPEWGVAGHLASRASATITPHSNSVLILKIAPPPAEQGKVLRSWVLKIYDTSLDPVLLGEVKTETSEGPWLLTLPLKGGTTQEIRLEADTPSSIDKAPFPFPLLDLQIDNTH